MVNPEQMRSTLFYLLCAFALLGSIDVAYFHIYRLKLYRLPDSRTEHATHLMRALLFLMTLVWVMWCDVGGIYSVGLCVILGLDFVNSMADVLLEPHSRRALGGLPPLEYAIHMLTMFVSGAIMTLAVVQCLLLMSMPNRWQLRSVDVPLAAWMLGCQIVLVTIGLCITEVVGMVRSFRRPTPQR